jgi:hypothetical protein
MVKGAVVTGSSSGIGCYEISLLLARTKSKHMQLKDQVRRNTKYYNPHEKRLYFNRLM